jgi:hypothetical protein
VNATNVTFTVSPACLNLRQYEDMPVEDASLYTSVDISGDALVLVSGSNFRTGPGLSFPATRSLLVGSVVEITGRDESSQWLQVLTEDGESGWMFVDLLRVYIEIESLDVVVGPDDEATPEATATPAESQ